jgi:hypothetical protein
MMSHIADRNSWVNPTVWRWCDTFSHLDVRQVVIDHHRHE